MITKTEKGSAFRINHPTGYVEVTPSFFIEVGVNRIKKLCKLARKYSSQDERDLLILMLVQADRDRKELLDILGELAYKKAELTSNFFHTTSLPEKGWAEKRLISERKKLAQAIDILKAERWGT